MPTILETIQAPNDIKTVSPEQWNTLAAEIRQFLMRHVSKTGGHLASNLGAVELTMALHLTLDFPEDKLIWDVGHQAYTHKILTGRQQGFKNLRQYKGLSGFPKTNESDCDAFNVGHSSTSISVALGMAKARDLAGRKNKVVAVIGDGALSGGMAYEALNNAARLKSNLVIVLNDNNMSISENVGGMANYLGKIRTGAKYKNLKNGIENVLHNVPGGDTVVRKLKQSKDSLKRFFIPGMLFEDMGITYIGPIDGHDIQQMKRAFQTAQKSKEAVLVHVVTKKGKGYSMAEERPWDFHGVEPFIVKTGENKEKKKVKTYTKVFSDTIVKLAEEDERVTAVCAAMPSGTGLVAFRKKFPERFFDVGIAEEHAVTFAAGMAKEGYRPIVAIYSTFLQRSYDQIIHDVCLDRLPVIFAVDRAGLVGADGETHQGIYDASFLNTIPNLTILSPKNGKELEQMFRYALTVGGPVAIRYPRGEAYKGLEDYHAPIQMAKSELIYRENTVALLAAGSMVKEAEYVHDMLKEKGVASSLVNVRFLKPVDTVLLRELIKEHTVLVTMEENVTIGGFGQMVDSFLAEQEKPVQHINISIPDQFVEQGSVSILKEELQLDAAHITEKILNILM